MQAYMQLIRGQTCAAYTQDDISMTYVYAGAKCMPRAGMPFGVQG